MSRTKNATLSVAAPDTLADTIGAYLGWAADGLEVEWQGKLQFNILVDEDDYGGAYKNGTIHVNLLNGSVKAVSYRKVVKKGTHRNLLDLPPAKVGDLIDEYVRAIPWSGMEAPYDTPSIQDRHPDYDAYMSGRYASVRRKSRKRASYTFSKPMIDMLVAYLNQNTGGDFYWYRRGLEFHWQIDEVVERSREEEVAGNRKGRVVVDMDKGFIEARDKNDRSVKKGRIPKPLEMSPKKLERLVEDYYFHVPVIPDADQNRRWTGDPMLDMDDYPPGFDEDFDTPSIEERYPERSSYMSGRYASKKTAARFNLGQVVQTRGVAHAMRRDPEFAGEIMDAFNKYRRGDWGDTQSDSKRRNNAVLRGEEDQVFAVYNTSQGKVYIITEWDGSVTTILFANEY